MGSQYREPRPKSPERLSIKKVKSAGRDNKRGGIKVTVVFQYDTWCCTEAHEVQDAVNAVTETFEKAKRRAEKERNTFLQEEYSDILKDMVKGD